MLKSDSVLKIGHKCFEYFKLQPRTTANLDGANQCLIHGRNEKLSINID